LTFAFLSGTALACLALGASLGAISLLIPPSLQWYVEAGTGIILIGLGIILIIKPNLLHNQHDDKNCHHEHHHTNGCVRRKHKATGVVLFGIGFVNMIIPCPTVAIMYGYALESGSVTNATSVFAIYALTTSVAVGGVIYAIYKISRLLKTLNQHWVESAIIRTAGFVTVLFSFITLYHL